MVLEASPEGTTAFKVLYFFVYVIDASKFLLAHNYIKHYTLPSLFVDHHLKSYVFVVLAC